MPPPEEFIENLSALKHQATEKGHTMGPWRYSNPRSGALNIEAACLSCDALLSVNAQHITNRTVGGNILHAIEWPCLEGKRTMDVV
jgi:hypothetical protein